MRHRAAALAFFCWGAVVFSAAAVPVATAQQQQQRSTAQRPASSYYSSNVVSREYAAAFPDSAFAAAAASSSSVWDNSDVVSSLFPCLPQQLHLAQATDVLKNHGDDEQQQQQPDHVVSMTLSFALDYQHCRYGRPQVLYGRLRSDDDNGNHNNNNKPEGVVRGDNPLQFNYTSDETKESGDSDDDGIYQSDWIYHVQLPNLKAGREIYWYRIVVLEEAPSLPQDENNGPAAAPFVTQRRSLRGSVGYSLGETRTWTFATPPLPASPTTLALVGDLGQTIDSTRTVFDIYTATLSSSSKNDNNGPAPVPVSQLLIAGDMAYADSDPTRWTSWLRLMEPLARSLPVHVLPGNHEIECDTTTRDIFVPYEHWFRNPNRIRDAVSEPVDDDYRKTLWHQSCSAPSSFLGVYDYGNSFYSFQHGLAHVVALNSYTNTSVGSVQYRWLQAELQLRFDRSITPWLLVAFHAPLYTTFLGHENETEAVTMREATEPLFVEYGVNLIVSGHDHAYMRTHPLAFGQVDPSGKAPVYLTLGAGGNREGHAQGYRDESQEPWVAKRTLQDFGYGHLYIPNATHARFQWVRDNTSENHFEDIVWFRNPHVDEMVKER